MKKPGETPPKRSAHGMPGWLGAVGLLAASLSGAPARAELQLQATETLQRDDNVFRLPAGPSGEAPPEDTVQRTRLGWELQLQQGRQRLSSRGSWEDVHHRRWSVLSHQARELRHSAELQALAHGRLSLERSDRVALSTDDQLLSVLRNEPGLEHQWQNRAALRWEPPRGWGAYASWAEDARRYRSALDAARDVTQHSRSAGLSFRSPMGWSLEAGPLWREVARSALSGLPAERAHLIELAAVGATADGRWQASLRHAQGRRHADTTTGPGSATDPDPQTPNDPTVRSTRAELRWQPGTRWNARLSASDERGSDFLYGATPLADGTVALDVRGLLPRRLQVLQGEVGAAVGGQSRVTAWAQAARREGTDRLQAIGLTGQWRWNAHLGAGCALARETRQVSESTVLRPYHAQRWQCWVGWTGG